MQRRDFLRRSGLTAAALAGLGQSAPSQAASNSSGHHRRPNLLFVFTDQQSWDMLGCYGNGEIHTPHADRFAKQAVRLEHCFSSSPVCTPFRGMLMSGKHPLDNGCFSNDVALNPNAGPMIGKVLADAGYRTGYIGKWHLLGGHRDRPIPRGPLRMGFDSPTFYTDNCTTLFNPPDTFFWNHDDAKQPYGKWQPDGQTDQAIAFLEDHAAQHADDPFALFVSWHPPHDNGKTPDGYYRYALPPSKQALIDRYADRELSIRPNVPRQTPQRQQQLRDHYAMCTGIDECFGRLLDTLDRLDLADQTLVVFTSDHGDILGAYNWTKPKQIVHDVSSRVPCLIRMPGQLPANTATDLLFGTLDWMPTLLGLLGLEAPGGLHGVNQADALRTGNGNTAESVPMFLLMPVCNYRGVVTKRYTFAKQSRHTPKTDAGHPLNNVLFDRVADPHQLHNLFGNPEVAAIQRDLEAQTQAWCDRFDDDWVTFEQIGQTKPIGKWAMPEGDPSTWPTPRELLASRR